MMKKEAFLLLFGLLVMFQSGMANELILQRNFGMKTFCLSGLDVVDTNQQCSKSCFRDKFTDNIAVSTLLISNTASSQGLTVSLDTLSPNYSSIIVEIEYVEQMAAVANLARVLQNLGNITIDQFQIPNGQLRFTNLNPLVCQFSGNFEEMTLLSAYIVVPKPSSPSTMFTFNSIDSSSSSNDKYMTAFTIYSICVVNCKTCSSETSCSVCHDGYRKYTLEGTTDEICEITGNLGGKNCFSYTPGQSSYTCRKCMPGYTLDSDQNLCIDNLLELGTCPESNQYIENNTCKTYGSQGYYESTEGEYLQITQYTSLDIQLNYKCPYGTLALFNRIANYDQYSCRCQLSNCELCSAINTCDTCSIGFYFDSSKGECIRASFSSNSFTISQNVTDTGYDIQIKFNQKLLNTQISSSGLEISISDFNQFQIGEVSTTDSQNLQLKIGMLSQAKNKLITVQFTNSEFTAQNLIQNPQVSTNLKPFLQIQQSDKEAAETAKSVGQAASGAIVGTLLIIVIISNFSAIVATIDLTGFLYYLLYIEARFPINIVEFYAVFKNFQMDFIPNPFTDIVTPGYMQLSAVRFMQADTDGYFLVSTGQSVLIFLLIVIMYIVAKILSKIDIPFISNYFKKSVYETWEYGGYFDAVWTVYLYLMIGVLMQFQSFDCSDSSCGWNYFIFTISFIVSFGVPALIVKLIRDNPNIKDNEYMKTKLSSLIAGVRLYSEKEQKEVLSDQSSKLAVWRDSYSKKFSKYYMPILYIRKIIFGLIIVCLSSSGYSQLSLITLLNIGMTLYFILLRPLDSAYENYKGAISEIVMVVFQILVGILIQDPDSQEESDRINIGWVAIAIVSLVILWHTVGIIFDFLRAIWEALKAMVAKKSSAKVTPISQDELQDQSVFGKGKMNQSSTPLESPDRKNADIDRSNNHLNQGESELLQQSSDFLNQDRRKKHPTFTLKSTAINSISNLEQA